MGGPGAGEGYRRLVATDADELWQRIDEAHARFSRLAASVDPGLRPAGSAWTARDTVGHVLTVLHRYTDRDPTSTDGLGETPRAVDVLNERELRALDGVDLKTLLARVDAQMLKVRDAFGPQRRDATRLDTSYPFHGGASIDTAGALSNLVGEFLVHGRDVARAAGRPWRIASRDALLVLNGVVQIMPGYVQPGAEQSLALLLRLPDGVPWMLDFRHGTLDSRPAAAHDRVDVVLTAPPETLLLLVYSRMGRAAALRQGLRVSGRRPWRIARLPKLLQQP